MLNATRPNTAGLRYFLVKSHSLQGKHNAGQSAGKTSQPAMPSLVPKAGYRPRGLACTVQRTHSRGGGAALVGGGMLTPGWEHRQ